MSWGSEESRRKFEELWEYLSEKYPDHELILVGGRLAPIETAEPREEYL